ncbi:PhzF family phenazine biosynthesis protein [Deinococcus sp.]|uniref:PhzF family phenazine biosynthesis protein n=1 Tax=Deinococcus sp. TaxID=47478 RepID=UPI0025C29CFC|nr:PhzF family phenazine biosynthesis protein [Deinococcus sp.]
MTQPRPEAIYDVFQGRHGSGGKQVAVFGSADGDLQAAAAAAGTPLSVFIESADLTRLCLRVFTPTREKGESDSASVAALTHRQPHLLDMTEVLSSHPATPAQLCGGEWLLGQGVVSVQPTRLPTLALELPDPGPAHIAGTGRPNLLIEVPSLEALEQFTPEAGAISELGRATDTTGLILYTTAPLPADQGRADVCFRAFGPLKGFLEDAASSNMFACLTGVLAQRGQLAPDNNLIRGAQRQPGRPSRLTAQYGQPDEAVWVGGSAVRRAT